VGLPAVFHDVDPLAASAQFRHRIGFGALIEQQERPRRVDGTTCASSPWRSTRVADV
jgi:hypothetical protein